ncbi:hypothetical protein ACFPK9_01160 [Rubritalea spongiae]|uniref:Helix-turn-helix domain-containing protein n=1 Tax=Rubritalea spongiae TaxID=430797 RepID=A0ABW5DZA5_9BACT
MSRQLMLWETEVVPTGNGRAQVVAKKPLLEGGVDEARRVLGGLDAVTRDDIYRLIRRGYIRAWKKMPGVQRRDGRASNCKLVVDIESVLMHRQRMQEECMAPAERMENCSLF